MAGSRQLVESSGCWQDITEFNQNRTPPRRKSKKKNSSNDPAHATLASTIEREIIPRLLLAHSHPSSARTPKPADPGTASENVREFSKIILAHDVDVALSYVQTLRTQGTGLETIILDLLAPTARRLGELWEADLCDFTEVTVGLIRLQEVLREVGPAFESEVKPHDTGQRMLLVPAPGEQHTFGIFMVEEFFRRSGWDVVCETHGTALELAQAVHREWFTVVGLSLSCESRLETLAFGIRSIRRASLNRGIGVMVGGRVFVDKPELVVLIGADATAADAKQAVVQAQNLVGLKHQIC